jgi:hypothetical protein
MNRGACLALFIAALCPQAWADVPTEFTVQGVLRDGSGALQSVALDVSVSLWSAASGGTRLAGPYTKSGVPVSDGLFTFTVSDPALPATLASASAVWMEVSAGTNTFERQKVTSSFYAAVAGDSAKLNGAAGSSYQKVLSVADCGGGQHLQGVGPDGTVKCVADTSPGVGLYAPSPGVLAVSYAGTGVALSAARSDHSHTPVQSCTRRAGTPAYGTGTGQPFAYAACNTGEVITGGGCSSSSSSIQVSTMTTVNVKGQTIAPSWMCASVSTSASESLIPYAMCCTVTLN